MQTPLLTDDLALWQAFRRGDERAFTTLYHRHVRPLYTYGYKLAGDAANVEDAIQDLFVELWRKREGLAEVVTVRHYLYASLRRRLHRLHQRKARFTHESESTVERFLADDPPEYDLPGAEPEALSRRDLQRWLRSLPPRQYEALVLRFYDEFSFPEIADLLQVNEQSARNLVQRAVATLRHLALPLGMLLGGCLLF